MTKAEYRKARENFIVMFICTVLVAVLLVYVIPYLIKVPAAAKKDTFTPQTFPYFLGVVMAVCALVGDIKYGIIFVKARKEALQNGCLKEKDPPKSTHEKLVKMMPWIMYLLIVLYGYGINKIGFIIPTAIMIPVVLMLLRCKKWQYYLYVYLFAAAIWAAFKFLLHVQLP